LPCRTPVMRNKATVDLVTASLIGGDQFSVLRNYLLVGHYPFLGDVFFVDLDLAAALKVAKRVFRTGFVLVKPAKFGNRTRPWGFSGARL
jgi:hypothetical protein